MYGRNVRCLQGSVVEHERRATSAGSRSHLVKKGLVLWGCAAVSLALTAQAIAQSTTLPQVTVEGKGTTAKKGTAKGAPKAAPKQAPAEPVQEPETQASKEKAQKDAVYNTPAAVSTATRSDIETFGQVDTGDVLRSMPGTFTRESPQNAGLAVNIRGFEGAGRVNMMIDGVRQNFRFTGHEAQGFAYVDPSLLAGVDIARGAVSTAGGAGALVGAANLRTLGVDDIIKPGNKTGVLSTFSYGTNGVGWSEMLAAGVKAGGIGIAGAISHHEPDSYKNGNGVTVPLTQQDLVSGLFKVDLALSSEQSLKLGAVLYNNDFFANSYFQELDSKTYTVKYTYKPRDNPLIDFALNLSANDIEMTYLRNATGGGSAAGRVIQDKGAGFDVSNTSRFRFGDLRIASTYGYEFFQDDVEAFNKLTAANGAGVNPSGTSQIGGAFSRTQFSYGIFDLITGLRFDTYNIKGVYDDNGITAGGNLVPFEQADQRLSPKVTLAAQVLPWLQPYITYSEAFRPPTINETLMDGTHPSGPQVFAANPFLKPEVQKGWEFGANIRQDRIFTPRDSFRLKAAYFTMDVENFVVACSSSNPATPNPFGPAGSLFFCNAPGTSVVEGVEVEGQYDAGVVFAGLSYTYTNSKLPSPTNGLGATTFTPEHVTVGTFGMRFLEQKLTVGTRVSAFSETFVGGANCCNAATGASYGFPFMPGYVLVDLFSSYKFDSGFELGLTATNLFDVSYTPASSTPFTSPTGACFGSNFVGCNDSGRGRTVLLTSKAHF
jgi:hemoglobin/transferrin/lactoferrin receptor protein